MWFSTPSFWMGGGLESRCVGRVYGADGAVQRIVPCTAPSAPYTVALKTTTHPKIRCRKPYAACNSTSNALDDGRMYPKHVKLRIRQ